MLDHNIQAIVLLADYANLTGDGKLNVMGIFRVINTPSLPALLPSAFLIIRLNAGPLASSKEEHLLIAKLTDADGSVVHQIEMPFEIPERSNEAQLEPELNVILNLQGITFPTAGSYDWIVHIDNEDVVIDRYEMFVRVVD